MRKCARNGRSLSWIVSCSRPAQEEHMDTVTMETMTSVWTRRDAVALVILLGALSLACYWIR